ncbi:MAG: protein translocase subunit SecF [Dehalococcoidia bacterium]|nr:protein translocase subunit SecF [Dehalococcoidia bacterium]
MRDLVGKRYWFLLLSGVVIIPGLIALLIFGLRPGIDFSSGSIMSLKFADAIDQASLRQELTVLGQGDAIIQRSDPTTFLIRTREMAPAKPAADGQDAVPPEQDRLVASLKDKFGDVQVLSFDSVAPIVASETVKNATFAVVAAAIGILLYITWAFRKVARPFRYGACAVFALVHDVLVVVGVAAILGRLIDLEVDAMFITATLTVIGFSVHDTIVVFDRIRENMRRIGGGFDNVVNQSLLQTMGRSLSTSLTVVFTLLAILLFGGVTIRSFVLVLLVGIISGTYSSIFNASQLLVVWDHGDVSRLVRRLPMFQAGRQG